MKTIKSEFMGTDATGKDFFRVIIVSESAPDSFPTLGADVDGVPDTAGIAAGSVLLTPDGNSVLYTDDFNGGGGTPIVTFDNIIGEVIIAGVAYAASIQALMDGDVTVIPELPTGTTDIEIPAGMIIVTQSPVAFGHLSGALEEKTDPFTQTPYVLVNGSGVMELITQE